MLKTLWNDPVWSKVISAGILAAVASGGSYALNWWPTIGGYATQLFMLAIAPSLIANWILVLLVLLALPMLLLIIVAAWQWIRPAKQSQPSWKTYLSDEFFGLKWRWQYFGDAMSDMHTFCPNCDFQVYPERASSYIAVDRIAFRCDSCHRELCTFEDSYEAMENQAKRFAQQKIRTGRWRSPLET
jgi:hypothetical protein